MPNIIGPDCSFYQDDNATERMIDFAKMESNGTVSFFVCQ